MISRRLRNGVGGAGEPAVFVSGFALSEQGARHLSCFPSRCFMETLPLPIVNGSAKPDLCAYSHFGGYFDSDTGASAATPIPAGAAALLREAFPDVLQPELQGALRQTAQPHALAVRVGSGVARIGQAYDRLRMARTGIT